MTTKRRRVHFGIDYGTSNSKIVVRDFEAAGGERAHVVIQNDSERLSSSVALVQNEILFGFRRTNRHRVLENATWYESLKMRAAGEIKGNEASYFYGSLAPLPPGLNAQDLAALTIYWLLTEANNAAHTLVHLRQGEVIVPGMTIGIPMSFYTDASLRTAFVNIARVAWFLFKHAPLLRGSQIEVAKAKQCLADAYEAVTADPIPDDEVRFWARSEAEAALWWAFRSPQIADGPYVKLDIGAGTTNSSVFRIVAGHPDGVEEGPAVKLKMAFFGAASKPTGMDAVNETLARWQGLDASRAAELRGREDRLLQHREAWLACRDMFERMHGALCEAWLQNWRLIKRAHFEKQAWTNECKMFLIGGGSLVRAARGLVSEMPLSARRRLPIVNLESPPDLRLVGRQVPREVLSFVLVAYGLSVLAPPIPMVEKPDEVPPMPPTESTLLQLSHEDIYTY